MVCNLQVLWTKFCIPHFCMSSSHPPPWLWMLQQLLFQPPTQWLPVTFYNFTDIINMWYFCPLMYVSAHSAAVAHNTFLKLVLLPYYPLQKYMLNFPVIWGCYFSLYAPFVCVKPYLNAMEFLLSCLWYLTEVGTLQVGCKLVTCTIMVKLDSDLRLVSYFVINSI
jgi:hypothetical protein